MRDANFQPWPALDPTLMAQAAATYNFTLGRPVALAIAPDGTVVFRRTPARDFASDLYELAPDGTVRTLANTAKLLATDERLSDAEKARRERTRTATRGIVDVDLSHDGSRVMFALGGTIYVLERATGAITDLAIADAYDPHLSPDGAFVAFVRDGDLYVHAIAARETTRLARAPESFELGVADFAAQEEFDRSRGFWWSPDSTRIAFARVDNRAMETLYVADARHNERPPVPFKYPRAGTANAKVDVGVVAIAGGEPRFHAIGLEYLVDVDWDLHGGLTALVADRDQEVVRYLALETGAVLLEEHDAAWVNVDAGHPIWLVDGSGFLWMTESRGAWQVELHAPDGTLVRPLTTLEFGLRELVGVTRDAAIVLASTDATRVDAWRVPLAGGAPVRLSDGDGVATAVSRNDTIVVASSLATGGVTTYVAGATRRVLPSVAERPTLVPTTVLETVVLEDRIHHVAITRPRAFDPARRYPVLLNVYGGPGKQMVLAARDLYVMDQWYADAGFVVVRSDNRGSPGRDRAWGRAILRDLITVPLADQVEALHAIAARHRELDLARVGVYGWSFGGYFAALAAMLRPEVFACAIAGAPVTDWALYDTAYTERYMKQPTANAEGYARSSVLTHAKDLTRPLLVIHGITDDNVHFAHALALIEALYLAGKRAEVITVSSTHMVPDPTLYMARERVQIEFFREKL